MALPHTGFAPTNALVASGGSRLGSGLPTAYWENQGGRKEAAIAKRKRESEAADKAKRTWQKVAAKPAAEQQESGSHTNGEGQQA